MGQPLRVASFNIRTSRGQDGWNRWFFRRRACVAAIRGLAADVVGLQEVRPGQFEDLKRAFPTATFVGAGRDRDGGGERAAVLIAPTGWALESTETRWLSPTPAVPGSVGWDAALPRIVTLARLRRGDIRVGIANTHFDHSGRQARRESAELLAGWLAAEPDRPWVVTGDLNAGPGSPPLRRLTDDGFAEALTAAAGGTHHSFTGAKDRTQIDHVLAGRGIEMTAAWIDHRRPHGRLPSDHWPVVADLVVG